MMTRRGFFKVGGLAVASYGVAERLFSRSSPQVKWELQNMTANVKPLSPEDYVERIEKARWLMVQNKIDGFFLEGGPSLQYFTNVSWGRSERTFGAVITRRGGPVWVCSHFELERAKEVIPGNQEIRTWEEDESPFKLIQGIMKDAGYRTGRLGMEPSTRSFIICGVQREASGLHLVDGAVISEGCRGVKSKAEIGYMDLANRITKLAYREAFKQIKEGMSQKDLATLTGNYHQLMGVTGGGWPQFGQNSAFPHGSKVTRSLKQGDVIMVDGGCSVEGYRSDVTRSIVFGKPTDRHKRIWDAVGQAQQAAFRAVRPGVACEEIDRVARKVIEDAGFGFAYQYFVHRVGHGIGLEGHEYPYLVRGNKLPLQAGMTFSNEPGIYVYGEYGIRTEDCFVVTEDAAAWLGGMVATAIDNPFGE